MSARTGPLPAGTVTFLFSDIEGSTTLVQELRDRWPSLLEQHRQLVRAAVDAHRGVEIGTEGDSFFVVFERAGEAVAAARDAQLALAGHPWPADARIAVRMGLHTGEADVVADDYVGLAVHLAARVASAAHGGQVLLTEATRQLVPDVATLDLGDHRLKDIRRPAHLHQLLADGLGVEFPPPRTLSSVPNNLPAALDEFVGRAAEMDEVVEALRDHRLVTLTGPGGAGKTRLATEAAARLVGRFPGGVWLVELSTTDDASLVPVLVAQAAGVAEQPGRTIEETLRHELAGRELLLVLDNCEHVVAPVSRLVSSLLAACPAVRVLATSRARLGVRGEAAVPLPPLAVPDDATLAAESDAVRLFTARARAVDPDFDPRAAGLDHVAAVCRRLDGLPLAIELAAARARTLSVEQLAARLEGGFRLLSAKDRDVPERQRTLDSVVAWSYDLLDASEQALFRRLGVFPDSFTLEAAEAVAAGDGVPVEDVVDVLDALVDKSLVSTVDTETGRRYVLLETLRSFGRDRLEEAGERDGWSDRLLAWALGHVDGLEAAMRTPAQDAALLAVRPERANIRAAMERAREVGDLASALRIVSAVPIGLVSERHALLVDLLGRLPDAPPEVVGHARLTLGNLNLERGDYAGSMAAGREAEAAFETAGDHVRATWGTFFQVFGAWGLGDRAEVDRLSAAALERFRAHDVGLGIAYMAFVASQNTPDLERATAQAAEACERFRALGAEFGLAHALEGAALVAVRSGDLRGACPQVREALRLFRRSGNEGCTAHCLEAVAAVLAGTGDLGAVAELWAAAQAFREATGHAHRPWELGGNDELRRALDQSRDDLAVAAARGRTHSLTSAAERAAALLDRAHAQEVAAENP